MENIWKLIEKALGIDELHDTASKAKGELHELKDQVDELNKQGDGYVPKEYPKMLPNGTTVYNADEEAATTSKPVVDPVPANPESTVEATDEQEVVHE